MMAHEGKRVMTAANPGVKLPAIRCAAAAAVSPPSLRND
jgi:hypothetical protein